MPSKDAPTPIEYVLNIAKGAISSVVYHELCLPRHLANLGYAHELLKRAGIDEDDERASGEDHEESIYRTVEAFALGFLDHHEWQVSYHEEELRKAHNDLASVKILLVRGGYTEIDLVELERLERERRAQEET